MNPKAATKVQLHRCTSCDRLASPRLGANAPCPHCGGPLRTMWGLAQLPTERQAPDISDLVGAPAPPAEHADDAREETGQSKSVTA